MKPAESVEKFIEFAAASGVSIKSCAPREGFEQLFAFYDQVKAENCDTAGDDVLLFQWGVYDWGEGKFFDLNLTRQFVEAGLEDDDGISQLSYTFKFEPTARLSEVASGNCWSDGRFDSPTFQEFVFTSGAFLEVMALEVKHVELVHSYV